MMKKLSFAVSAAALALTTPVAAQEMSAEDAKALELMGSMFGKAEPLTAEQEGRMPAAEAVVGQIFPEGTYAKMMDETIKPMMDGMMGTMLQMPAAELANLTGLTPDDMEAQGEGSIGDAMAIMDPAYDERSKRIADASIKLVVDVMNQIEPSYRAGLARAYAVRFTEDELNQLNAFFETPVGAHYAAESMLIYTDPQVISAMNEMMPAMMEMMPQMMTAMAEATADLPEARKYSELSAEEQAKLADILSVSRDVLAEAEPVDALGWEEGEGEDVVEDAT